MNNISQLNDSEIPSSMHEIGIMLSPKLSVIGSTRSNSHSKKQSHVTSISKNQTQVLQTSILNQSQENGKGRLYFSEL
jgi:hypothetical protein